MKIVNFQNIAPPIDAEYLNQETVYYEDLINRFCVKYNLPVHCECSVDDECELLSHCKVANTVLNETGISTKNHK